MLMSFLAMWTGIGNGIALFTPQSSSPRCLPHPPQATQACRDCLDEACLEYIRSYLDCEGNTACQLAVKLAYDLRVTLCGDCWPSGNFTESAWAVVIEVLPVRSQEWVFQTIVQWPDLRLPIE